MVLRTQLEGSYRSPDAAEEASKKADSLDSKITGGLPVLCSPGVGGAELSFLGVCLVRPAVFLGSTERCRSILAEVSPESV